MDVVQTTPLRGARALLAAGALLLAAACSSGGSDSDAAATPDVPKGFDVPAGVTLTAGGSTLERGTSATVVYQVGTKAASAVTVTVKDIRKGDIAKDFTFFSLDDAAKSSTPYYVDLSVANEGPAGLGGVSLPVLAHTASNTVYPPNELVGDFEPCPQAALPKNFLEGATADLCMVYLLPKGETLKTIDLQPGDEDDAIHWKP